MCHKTHLILQQISLILLLSSSLLELFWYHFLATLTVDKLYVSSSFYLNDGFLQLENVLDRAIIEWKTGQAVEMDVEVRVSGCLKSCKHALHD